MAAVAEVRAVVELYGTRHCPYTSDAREHLELGRVPFTEYDVELDPDARQRLLALTGGTAVVPVLVQDGRVTEIGWRGRGCAIGPGAASAGRGRPCGL
jgi:glutaredoxin 3